LTIGTAQVPQVSVTLTFADRLGAWRARWGIGRMNYMVPPGLYAIGNPTPEAPVLVTANYKMSYDTIRSILAERNVWLLVLETFGINVWCAAGKGTFGTEELVRRIGLSGLEKIVAHRQLILPILGAPGVAAHEVKKQTGFTIRYATIRADDLPEYLDNGMVTTPAMGEITFTTLERLVLIPVELVQALKPTAITAAILFIIVSVLQGAANGVTAVYAYLGAVVAGAAIAPLLLPWLPGRSFAGKGALMGLVWSAAFYLIAGAGGWSVPVIVAAFLMLSAVSAFYTLNFTGCTTYTSRSGVKKEMRIAMPTMACAVLVSLIFLFVGRLL